MKLLHDEVNKSHPSLHVSTVLSEPTKTKQHIMESYTSVYDSY